MTIAYSDNTFALCIYLLNYMISWDIIFQIIQAIEEEVLLQRLYCQISLQSINLDLRKAPN